LEKDDFYEALRLNNDMKFRKAFLYNEGRFVGSLQNDWITKTDKIAKISSQNMVNNKELVDMFLHSPNQTHQLSTEED
jgi:hypothetical protein